MKVKYSYNKNIFVNEEILYYLLGVFMTDGCCLPKNKSIELTSIDYDWIKSINDIICHDKPIMIVRNKYYRVSYNFRELYDWLISKGCVPRKSLILKFPDVPDQYLIDFIRGCWDGDGHISIHSYETEKYSHRMNRCVSIGSGSHFFLEEMNKRLSNLGLYSSFSKRKSSIKRFGRNDFYELKITNSINIIKFAKTIYITSGPALKRKQDAAVRIIEEWEKDFYCMYCNTIIKNISKNRRNKFCDECKIIRKKEIQNKADRKRNCKSNTVI